MQFTMRILMTALTVALFFANTYGQTTTTGTIEGVITDSHGAVVPGVTITATSPNLIQPVVALTVNSKKQIHQSTLM